MKTLILVLLAIAAFFVQASTGMADNEIIVPYQSVRSAGMGGLLLTTGLYEDNFFANPARVTANPTWRVNLPDPTVEINSHLVSTIKDVTGNDSISNIANTAGNNDHGRFQMTFPSIFIPAGDLSFAIGLVTSVQANVELNKNFDATTQGIADVGAVFQVGYKMLDDKSLSIGAGMHVAYRGTAGTDTSVAQVLEDPSKIFNSSDAQRGGTIDFDIGTTYVLPFKLDEIDFTAAAAVDNIFGGQYNRFAVGTTTDPNTGALINNPPPAQPRTLGFGVAAHEPSLWIFTDPVLGLEFQNIGNNTDGGMFRTVHIGGECHWGVLAPRLGINQGYFTAGLGINLPILQIDVSTYGEELTLNPGGDEDRRYAIRLGLHI